MEKSFVGRSLHRAPSPLSVVNREGGCAFLLKIVFSFEFGGDLVFNTL